MTAQSDVQVRFETVVISTYPYAEYLTTVQDPVFGIPYRKLNWAAYEGSHPVPSPREYILIVLENEYLRVSLLPELGGRVYQIIFKPTGNNVLYQNPVLKPTHWGPSDQGWWLAAGGIEWCFPVDEHGYEWGEPWSTEIVTSTQGVTVTVRDTTADRARVSVAIHLSPARGYLAITPQIENPTDIPITYKYWTNAMLAPGPGNSVGAETQFVFPTTEVAIHSTGDCRLPGCGTQPTAPNYRIPWPVYQGVDYSRLGNWREWIGFFEYPQAQGPFAGVYDRAADIGVVRVFPPDIARGSKGFGFGWSAPIDARHWTDDGSMYVELHGGAAPTFWDTVTLPPDQVARWTEYWYPLSGIGRLDAATAVAAIGVQVADGRFQVGLHTTEPYSAGHGTLYGWECTRCAGLGHWDVPAIAPGNPFSVTVPTAGRRLTETAWVYLNTTGEVQVAFNACQCAPPTTTVAPLPSWVTTNSFTVTWKLPETWSGVARYDVQFRDGYEGKWRDWLTGTYALSATFTAPSSNGHTFFFRARARSPYGDSAPYGHKDEQWGQAFSSILMTPAPVLVTSSKDATPYLFHLGENLTYTIVVENTGNLTAQVAMTDTLPATLELVMAEEPVGTTGELPGSIRRWNGALPPAMSLRFRYVFSPTEATPLGVPLTNTVELSGSVLGPVVRRATVVRAYRCWLPLILK